MKNRSKLLAGLGLIPLLATLFASAAPAQTEIGKTIIGQLAAKVAKLESACAGDIKKYCKTVTPGEGRLIYCMQAHEDKISPKCTYELGETASSVQGTADALKDAVITCRTEITGVCGKTVPGQGRLAACLIANKSTASKDCGDAISRVEALATAR